MRILFGLLGLKAEELHGDLSQLQVWMAFVGVFRTLCLESCAY